MRHRPGASLPTSARSRVTRFGAFALVALLAPIAAPAQVVRERVSVEVVTVTVAARDSAGRPVRDLRASDLILSVDGKSVPIDTFTLEPRRPAMPASLAEAQPSLTPPNAPENTEIELATPLESRELLQVAVLVDEGSTGVFDRRDVFRQLERYFRDAASTERSVLIARVNGPKVDVVCPWTQEPGNVSAALAELSAHPHTPRFVSPHEIPTLGSANRQSLQTEILFARDNLFRAIAVMIAAFPPEPARRRLVLVTGGIALIPPPDFGDIVRNAAVQTETGRDQDRLLDPRRELEQARIGFELWANASRRDWYAQLADVMAKAQEKDVALVPVAAEAFDRGTNPGAESNTTGPSVKWAVRAMPGVGGPGSSGLSPRMFAGQTMTTMAIQTGGQPILQPLQAADRLSDLQVSEQYLLTFRNPFHDDHRRHRVELSTVRRGVTLQYRRGYRLPTQEEEVLDGLMARLVGPAPTVNPLGATVTIARNTDPAVAAPLRLQFQFQPPPEHGLEAEKERSVELVFASVDDAGGRSDPAKWEGTARRDEAGQFFSAEFGLKLPLQHYRWSIAVRDGPTGLVSYVTAESRP